MWTETDRSRYRQAGDCLPSDLTDAESERLAQGIPPAKPGGRQRKTDMRSSMNAIFYLLRTGCQRFNWLELVWADGGYNARQVEHAVAAQPQLRVEIVKRHDGSSGFIVLPRRWVVERTFSWFGRNRRLAKDYENLADTLAAFITLACLQLAIRRLARA
jgi:transposase